MATKTVIRNNKLIKKPIPLYEFLNCGQYGYGVWNRNHVLDEGKTGTSVVLFDKQHIGRGVLIDGLDNFKELSISLLQPATEYDYKLYLKIIDRAVQTWNARDVMMDGIKVRREHLSGKMAMEDVRKWDRELDDVIILSCAKFPISISKEVLMSMNDVQFIDYLHSRQEKDLWYSTPVLSRSSVTGQIIARYIIIDEAPFVLPMESCGNIMDSIGNKYMIDTSFICFYPNDSSNSLEEGFEAFMLKTKSRQSVFDPEHLFFEAMSEDEIKKIFQG